MNRCQRDMMENRSAEDLLWDLEKVKAEMSASRSETDSWSQRQKLQDMCRSLLLKDLSAGLECGAERDLWTMAFHQQIKALQAAVKDSRGSPAEESIQANLSLFMDCAQGFLMQFLQELSAKFSIDMPFHACGRWFGNLCDVSVEVSSLEPQKAYICQYCLIHLGDICRYRHQYRQSALYYRYAAQLRPCNGHPYHQLGVLAAAEDQPLKAIMYHCRSLCSRYPFPSAEVNLVALLTKFSSPESEVKFSDLWLGFLSRAVRSVKAAPAVSVAMDDIMALLKPTLQGAIANDNTGFGKVLECVAVSSVYCLVFLRPADATVLGGKESPWQAVTKSVMGILDILVSHLKAKPAVLPAVSVLIQCLQSNWSNLSSFVPNTVISALVDFLGSSSSQSASQAENPLLKELDGLFLTQGEGSSPKLPATCRAALRSFCDYLISMDDRRIHCNVGGMYVYHEPRASLRSDAFKTQTVGRSPAPISRPRPASSGKLAAVFSTPRVTSGNTRPK